MTGQRQRVNVAISNNKSSIINVYSFNFVARVESSSISQNKNLVKKKIFSFIHPELVLLVVEKERKYFYLNCSFL